MLISPDNSQDIIATAYFLGVSKPINWLYYHYKGFHQENYYPLCLATKTRMLEMNHYIDVKLPVLL